ncbi:hypothetical protein RND71_040370 [Anisodus tanguticus]|uniref:Uncharacterized protein n=1 Tax=Anisodus tanguticus TaxID=243964 RepID=A0AAE1QSQ5_9SOLA|nr:hypothetical protein RND71_040370 [Anisodus tanguticus]
MAANRRRVGDDRFYSPPAMRKQQKMKSKSRIEPESRTGSDDGASSTTSFSSIRIENLTNFDRFLEHTTPKVTAQSFPKTIIRGMRNLENDPHPYFILGDLWESFGEWSAYGAGVPLVLNQSDCVIQYYVPYLSGIQLYIDPLRPSIKQRRPGEESDADSLKETSSDDSSEYGAGASKVANKVHGSWNQQIVIDGIKHLSLKKDPLLESSGDENEMGTSPGLLVFEYFERNQPYGREPLADKAIPRTDWPQQHGTTTSRGIVDAGMSAKLPLPIFGLASYKFQVSFWFPDGVNECQKVNSLLRAADNWLRLLQVNHPDYSFFASYNAYRR